MSSSTSPVSDQVQSFDSREAFNEFISLCDAVVDLTASIIASQPGGSEVLSSLALDDLPGSLVENEETVGSQEFATNTTATENTQSDAFSEGKNLSTPSTPVVDIATTTPQPSGPSSFNATPTTPISYERNEVHSTTPPTTPESPSGHQPMSKNSITPVRRMTRARSSALAGKVKPEETRVQAEEVKEKPVEGKGEKAKDARQKPEKRKKDTKDKQKVEPKKRAPKGKVANVQPPQQPTPQEKTINYTIEGGKKITFTEQEWEVVHILAGMQRRADASRNTKRAREDEEEPEVGPSVNHNNATKRRKTA